MDQNRKYLSLNLGAVQFSEKEKDLVQVGELSVSTFRYESGVAALRVVGQRGEMVVLPFHGQQIWRARFDGRELTMSSIFDEPTSLTQYTRNYGAFFLHCGLSGLGAPGPGDTHPVHGELPHATYDAASLVIGESEHGQFAELTGRYRHRDAFSADYEFTPSLRFHECSARLDMRIRIRNARRQPFEYLYLGHINFRPIEGGRIIDSAVGLPERVHVRRPKEDIEPSNERHRELLDALALNPELHRAIGRQTVDPALVISLSLPSGSDGWSHAMQILPDGSADFVSVRPEEFDHCGRWMVCNGDEDALGLLLPATADADGYQAEKAKGNVRTLGAGAEFAAHFKFGALDAQEAAALAEHMGSPPSDKRSSTRP